jgi:hypothetical protein
MSNQSEDDAKTVSEWKLYEKLLIAFREAKENSLTWRDCEAAAEGANSEVFPINVDIESERKAAP